MLDDAQIGESFEFQTALRRPPPDYRISNTAHWRMVLNIDWLKLAVLGDKMTLPGMPCWGSRGRQSTRHLTGCAPTTNQRPLLCHCALATPTAQKAVWIPPNV
eukprot:6197106-Pleurochrysis_carterae.AAC.3